MSPKKVLFVCYGGGHVNMVIPVYRELAKDSRFSPMILGLTSAQNNLKAAGIPCFGYRDLLTPDDESALAHGRRLIATLEQGGLIDVEESIAYMGLSYWDLEQRLGPEEAGRLFAEKGRHAFLQLTIMERALKKWQPDVVVATNSPKSEKASLLKAREMGIPSICIIDLFNEKEFVDRLATPGYADRLCVFGEFVKERLMALGRKASEVTVTGNPAFDRLAEKVPAPVVDEFLIQRGWKGRPVILWARTHSADDQPATNAVEQEILRISRERPDWQFVIRPHPNETKTYSSLPANVAISPREEDLKLLLQVSQVVMAVQSTVGLEAALVDKPVLQMLFGPSAKNLNFAEKGLALGVESPQQIENSLLKALAGEIKKPLLPPPGQAARNIVRVIRELSGVTD